jgi:hypothetical protein
MRVVSFPLPIVFFVWEEDHWTDFVTPGWYVCPALAANICSVTAAIVLPFLGISVLSRRGRGSNPPPSR